MDTKCYDKSEFLFIDKEIKVGKKRDNIPKN